MIERVLLFFRRMTDVVPPNPLTLDARRAALAELLSCFVDVMPTSKEELQWYVETFYGYRIPDVAVCDGHCSPLDALWDAFTDATTNTIWIGPRTGGKTLQFAILDHLCMKFHADTIANVGAVEEQAKKCYSYFQKFSDLPHFKAELMKAPMLSKTFFRNGAQLEILPATMNRVNSPHPRRAHWDEIELTTQAILNEGKSMPVRTNGRPPAQIFTSSRKKAFGPMEDMLKTAAEAGRDVYKWCLAYGTPVSTMQGKKAIQEVRAGDYVLALDAGRFRYARVSWAGITGYRQTVVVRLTDGREIRCTADHEILTERGWVAAGALRDLRHAEVDRVAAQRRSLRLRASKVSSLKGLWGMPSQAARSPKQEPAYADRVGACSQATAKHSLESGNPGCQASDRVRHTVSATNPGGNVNGRLLSLQRLRNRGARLASRTRANSIEGQRKATAPARARLQRRGPLGGGNGDVGIDAPSYVRVESVREAPAIAVYDLTVPGPHNFLANGIVVHNCVFEIIEKCPEERHQNGAGCETCPLKNICKEQVYDEQFGGKKFVEGPGRAARANGWMKIEDVIQKYRDISWDVFRSQWLSERPETAGLVYPMFNVDVHVIDYEISQNFPIACGIDFGFINPSVQVAVQHRPDNTLVICDEIYVRGVLDDAFADLIKQKPWFRKDQARIADSADPAAIQTLNDHGVPCEAADKSQAKGQSSVVNGINLVRWLLEPQGSPKPYLYVARHCVNTIDEFLTYHHPDVKEHIDPEEKPQKQRDHAMDALRYVLAWLFRSWGV